MCLFRIISYGLVFERKQMILSNKRLNAMIADTPRKMTVGLMFRKPMKHNECMLFIFPDDGSHPIWMKNMRFSIDILWLDDKMRVVSIIESAKPLSGFDLTSYKSKKPSKYVVELNSGFVRENRIRIGDKARMP